MASLGPRYHCSRLVGFSVKIARQDFLETSCQRAMMHSSWKIAAAKEQSVELPLVAEWRRSPHWRFRVAPHSCLRAAGDPTVDFQWMALRQASLGPPSVSTP